MDMKLKLSEILDINNTLKLIIDDNKTKINVLLKFRLLGIAKAIEPHIINFETIKNEKIIEYGKKNKDGIYQISKDNQKGIEKFSTDIKQVLESTISINIDPLKIGEVMNSGLNSKYLIGLYLIIKNQTS
ncbi:hypothetical protein NSB25_25835 [Acetatifactor muris]|uniref:Uncharacterized protein n=1 Tax=Acetatifactor muris TaxID=879566 RepID=A0A2K4ZP61_9FIRM|nr:hypothetical protein [Acetatifactor muris]MCR2050658.1 hypothetical protein [Acetatifactor muris]SOY32206.1 hypothetical protein AMURIS_04964 [Acetatifactor muris]